METIIGAILSYLISLAAGLRSGAILKKEEQELKKRLEKETEALQAIQDCRSLKEQLRLVGTEAARITAKAGVTDAEKPLFMLLTDEVFQEDMAKWLTAWRSENKKEAEAVLAEQIVKALQRGGVNDKKIEQFKSGYFDRIEKVVFSDPVLANWRLTLAFNAAFERLDELVAILRLREDEILELMEKMRGEYPNVRAAKKHDPGEFLRMLEGRTGILIETREIRHKGRPVPVFEFRHLTFQEYLAALALVDGKFPGRNKSKSLAEHIAPLTGQTELIQKKIFIEEKEEEAVVKDNWREVLRLCAACCGDDDVDKVLLAILKPQKGEKLEETARPRAVLAALCLADELNVSDGAAQQVLGTFVQKIGKDDGRGPVITSLDTAAVELADTEWEKRLRSLLIEDFCKREVLNRSGPGSLSPMIALHSAPLDNKKFQMWLAKIVEKLNSTDDSIKIDAALTIMESAF